MDITKKLVFVRGTRYSLTDRGTEIGHAYLYLPSNDPHIIPFGFMEDVYVEEEHRKSGNGTALVNALVEDAGKDAYKLVATSRHDRPKVHELYEKLGFTNWGVEFRMDFTR